MTRPTEERQFITVAEIAETLGICMSAAYVVVRGQLPYIRIGKIYRVRRTVFEDWMHRQEIRARR